MMLNWAETGRTASCDGAVARNRTEQGFQALVLVQSYEFVERI